MKPDWKDAPEWANWLAMDSDGAWFWFQLKPDLSSGMWRSVLHGDTTYAGQTPYQNSLEARPNDSRDS